MSVLVIVAIKTRRRLQSTYNMLLACLAGTDLAVGVVSQPLFIAQEIYFLSGASLVHYIRIFYVIFIPCLESLLILVVMSIERYIAMKYSLKYANIVTTPRLIGVVICSWLQSAIYYISLIIPAPSSTYSGLIVYVIVSIAIFIIVFCRTTVYFVSHRHMNQIKTQHLSSETTSNFLEERKALKTTSLILVSLFLSYVQGILDGLFRFVGVLHKSYSKAQIRLLAIAFLCIFLALSLTRLYFAGGTKTYVKSCWNGSRSDKMETLAKYITVSDDLPETVCAWSAQSAKIPFFESKAVCSFRRFQKRIFDPRVAETGFVIFVTFRKSVQYV